ncbi:MAG: SGNH/GDSL hydrolase family protein [Hyphomicrobiaceae bacterium]|nr:SGNH/GDSL hydrolase family protein [Hyphomicrobiaceae bacterium]
MPVLARVALAVVCIAVAAELICRFGVGLGDPPLFRIDSDIEYLAAPSRCHQRFGNSVCFNSLSMRAEEPPPRAAGAARILVLGDSIIHGGVLTDQAELATSLLQKGLGREAWVGNASAPSWGPANLLAYTRRFGWLQADLAILVLSSHDLTDLPEFRQDYGADYPIRPPHLALEEAVTRYGPRVFPPLAALSPQATPPRRTYTEDQRTREGVAALADLLRQMKAGAGAAYVVLYPTVTELDGGPAPERALEIAEIRKLGLPYIDLIGAKTWRRSYYRDDIHPNAEGQAALAAILRCLWDGRGAACAQ